MKLFASIAILATSTLLMTSHGASAADTNPLLSLFRKPVPITHVYAPRGFDGNDEVQVVVTGYLPNLCYRAPRATAVVEGDFIRVRVDALVQPGIGPFVCAQMTVPFMETVSVGVLNPGKYSVRAADSDEVVAKFMVEAAAAPSIDDHVYANVYAVVHTPGTRSITLTGYNPSPCYELDRIEFIPNGVDTYSVLPIMKQIRTLCAMKLMPFSYEASVPEMMVEPREVLLHVRAMSGKSVNTIARFRE